MKTGILLVNLGTPDDPSPRSVGKYLKEFLMDPFVIDIPAFFRWILVHLLVVPRRSKASALLYQKVWDQDGSPLLKHTLALEKKMKAALGSAFVVKAAMRYGNPSLPAGIHFLKDAGVERIVVVPLYPQYSLAASESSIQRVKALASGICPKIPLQIIAPFYNEDAYLDAVAEVSLPYVRKRPYDLVLFSFHGLPERQVKKTDPSGKLCLMSDTCCETPAPENQNCYRHHCYVTARRLAEKMRINPLRYVVCFQSRLGRTPWIKPYTDAFYRTFPQRGIRRLLVISPSFVADCLETVEEIQLRGRDEFLRHGGEDLLLVPSLNSHDAWIKGLSELLRKKGALLNESVEHRPAGKVDKAGGPKKQEGEGLPLQG
jgi:protoporphyrin/coproporphyrin ferrochelatase